MQGEAHDASKLPPPKTAPDDEEVAVQGRAAVKEDARNQPVWYSQAAQSNVRSVSVFP